MWGEHTQVKTRFLKSNENHWKEEFLKIKTHCQVEWLRPYNISEESQLRAAYVNSSRLQGGESCCFLITSPSLSLGRRDTDHTAGKHQSKGARLSNRVEYGGMRSRLEPSWVLPELLSQGPGIDLLSKLPVASTPWHVQSGLRKVHMSRGPIQEAAWFKGISYIQPLPTWRLRPTDNRECWPWKQN